jgi:hypothetical protein
VRYKLLSVAAPYRVGTRRGPDPDATIKMGMNITRLDGILRLTVTDSKGMSVVHLDGMRPEVLRLWPLCAGCASCP